MLGKRPANMDAEVTEPSGRMSMNRHSSWRAHRPSGRPHRRRHWSVGVLGRVGCARRLSFDNGYVDEFFERSDDQHVNHVRREPFASRGSHFEALEVRAVHAFTWVLDYPDPIMRAPRRTATPMSATSQATHRRSKLLHTLVGTTKSGGRHRRARKPPSWSPSCSSTSNACVRMGCPIFPIPPPRAASQFRTRSTRTGHCSHEPITSAAISCPPGRPR